MPDEDKADVVENLNKLTAALEGEKREPGRIQRFWNRIKEVAPVVADILKSAASVAAILKGGA